MADGDGRIGVEQQERHGTAHDVAAPDDDGILSSRRNAAALQHLHHAEGRAGDRSLLLEGEAADVLREKTVHVLFGRNEGKQPLFIEALRQRQLHEDAVNVLIRRKRRDELLRLLLGGLLGKVVAEGTDTRLLARLHLIADVHLRGRIIADEHDR